MANQYLTEALAAVPGYTDYAAALARLDGYEPAPDADRFDALAAGRQLAEAARSGEPFPAGLGRRITEAHQSRQLAELEREAATFAREQLTEQQRLAAGNGVDTALVFLRGHLDELLGEAAGLVPALGDAATADDVLTAGADAVDSWQRLGELADDYQAIRAAQRSLVELRYTNLNNSVTVDHPLVRNVPAHRVLDVSGSIANLDQVWPSWRAAPGAGRRGAPAGWTVSSEAPPWQHADNPLQPVADRTYLRWLITSDALPWLPDIRSMIDNFAGQLDAADQRHAAERGNRIPNITSTETDRARRGGLEIGSDISSDINAELATFRQISANNIPTRTTT